MNKREAKLRALKLCVYCLEQDFALDGIFDMVDEDTPDDEALRIGHEAREFMKSLHKRIKRLETRLTQRAVDDGQAACIPSDMQDLYPRFEQSNAEARRR